MRLAYADPPYPGQAYSRYGGTEVNHRILIETLMVEADRWALSTSSIALADILPLVPKPYRIGIWVKSFSNSGNIRPSFSWEPVIFHNVQRVEKTSPDNPKLHDWVWSNPVGLNNKRFWLKFDGMGSKPSEFCHWLFRCLGASEGDTFWDVFRGSGAVSRAWDVYCGRGWPADENDLPLFNREQP